MSITITLTYATPELAIAALKRLEVTDTAKDAVAPVEKPAKTTVTGAPGQHIVKAEAEGGAAPAKTAAESGPSVASAAAAQAASTAAPEVAYADLQKAILSLHKLDPNATLAIAKDLGLDNFKPLKEEADGARRAQALALINAKLAELGA